MAEKKKAGTPNEGVMQRCGNLWSVEETKALFILPNVIGLNDLSGKGPLLSQYSQTLMMV